MRASFFIWSKQAALIAAVAFLIHCSPEPQGETGSIGVSLALPPDLDGVTAILFEVTGEDGTTQSQVVPLSLQPLPPEVDPALAGHDFADWFVVLNPGLYRVRAVPLRSIDPLEPSEVCPAVEGSAAVFEGMTTELVLVSNCLTEGSGALDTVVVLNRLPFIEELVFEEDKFICRDEAAVMWATASDADGDALSFDWSVSGLPSGADDDSYCLVFDGAHARFSAVVHGRYELTLSVSDGLGIAQLTFPVYVTECGDAVCPGDAVGNGVGVAVGRCNCEPGPCFSNDSCADTEFCHFETGVCAGPGECAPRPQGCPEVFDPVCGCDGVTYGNECEAAANGTSVADEGPCQIACGNGVVEPGEDCDDGNNVDGDGCNANCTYQFCGGIAGIACPDGHICVDDPRDDCDPLMGGADCSGICVPG